MLALAPALAAQRLVPRAGRPVAGIAPILLDFQTEDDFVTPLGNGQSISSPDEFGALVSISGTGANDGPAIFDSTPGGPNDPCQDLDLLVALGNLLILQNSQAPAQTTPGFFDRPNDDQDGGQLVFDFVTPVTPVSLTLVDIDAGTNLASSVTLVDEAGLTRVYTVPPHWTRDLLADGAPAWGSLDLQVTDPQPGFLSTATAAQAPGFVAERVVRLVVSLGSSGAVDDLKWLPGRSVGMVADDTSDSVVVLDADRDTVLGTVALPMADAVGDCAIDRRTGLGYVTSFLGRVWVIELLHVPPRLAPGVNPILVSNPGEDLSLSPDGRFLAVSDGMGLVPLSIVDVATRMEVGTVSTGAGCNAVDFCTESSLVGASAELNLVFRFALDGNGTPSLTGESLAFPDPTNLTSAPGGRTAVAVGLYPVRLTSFQVDGMAAGTTTAIVGGYGVSVCFPPDGRRLFTREFSRVEARTYDPLTGVMGAAPLYAFATAEAPSYYGMDQIAVHPDGSRLFVPVPGAVDIHDPSTGALIYAIPIPTLAAPTGIAVERGLR